MARTRRLLARVFGFLSAAAILIAAEAGHCATVQMPGSLTDENVEHSLGASARRWHVEYIEPDGPPVHADGGNWEFRATERATGVTKTFRSGTESGYFVLVRTYESLALVGAYIPRGGWDFTIYDLEAERKIVEFWAAFPHMSPDNRYLVYRQFSNRRFDPRTRIVDLGQDFGKVEVDVLNPVGFGKVVFPWAPPIFGPVLDGAYGTLVTFSPFDRVAWDMDKAVLYFTATDRTGITNLVAVALTPTPKVACRVPLTGAMLRAEYFEEKLVRPGELSLEPPYTVVVATSSGFGVRSEHRISLDRGCREQNRDFVERLGTVGEGYSPASETEIPAPRTTSGGD